MTRVTRRMTLVEQELFTLPEHMSSPPVLSCVRVAPSLVFNVVFCSSLFVLFIIVFSALLLVTAFYYSCGILPMYDGDRP